MKTVDDYERIRKAYYLEGLSIREISRRLHHSRRLIRKAIDHAQPEGYQLKQERPAPVLAPYKPKIDALIEESEQLPRKQRASLCQPAKEGSQTSPSLFAAGI